MFIMTDGTPVTLTIRILTAFLHIRRAERANETITTRKTAAAWYSAMLCAGTFKVVKRLTLRATLGAHAT